MITSHNFKFANIHENDTLTFKNKQNGSITLKVTSFIEVQNNTYIQRNTHGSERAFIAYCEENNYYYFVQQVVTNNNYYISRIKHYNKYLAFTKQDVVNFKYVGEYAIIAHSA